MDFSFPRTCGSQSSWTAAPRECWAGRNPSGWWWHRSSLNSLSLGKAGGALPASSRIHVDQCSGLTRSPYLPLRSVRWTQPMGNGSPAQTSASWPMHQFYLPVRHIQIQQCVGEKRTKFWYKGSKRVAAWKNQQILLGCENEPPYWSKYFCPIERENVNPLFA